MSNYVVATTHTDTVNHQLIFDSEGFYVVGDGQWQDIVFLTTLVYNGGKIGIVPRIYEENFYMQLSIHNDYADENNTTQIGFASLDVQTAYETENVAQAKIDPLVVGQSYTFKAEITGTNYKISLNDTIIFNKEYPWLTKGSVGLYSTSGNACTSIEIQSIFADGWISNADTVLGSTVDIRELDDENKYLYIRGSDYNASLPYAYQTRTVTAGVTHTLSFNYQGSGTARIREMNGTGLVTNNFVLPLVNDWTYQTFTQPIATDCTSLQVMFYTSQGKELMVNDVQLEDKKFSTGYIHNDSLTAPMTRETSLVTYPSKDNIKPDVGTIAMWVKPSIDYTATTGGITVMFEYGDTNPIRIYYDGSTGTLRFKYGTASSIAFTTSLVKDSWYNIIATWSESEIQLWLDGDNISTKGTYALPGSSDVIRVGNSSDATYKLFSGAIDETIVLSKIIDDETAKAAATAIEPLAESNAMIMRATFNYAIGNFNKSIIEAALIPNYGSPVLVEKSDGTAMRKVSFFDFYSGEYRTFNEEMIQYDMDYDYIELSYYDKDIDQQTFKVSVEDVDGTLRGTNYTLKGRKLYLNLTEDEKAELDAQYLWVSYQLEDSYTVDFNIGVPDAFRVTLGKYDGQPVKVTYEGNRFTDEKLATMIEMNPMLNPNHQGFLYVTRNDEKITAFRTMATPSDLPANGGDEALIVIEPLDSYGNFVSHCKLEVSCERGVIVPAYDTDSIKLRERAGRFLYRYYSDVIMFDTEKAYEVIDNISVLDTDTGIGVQIPITLTTLREENHIIAAGDTLDSITSRYGATAEDIMIANKKNTVADISSYIINKSNVGKVIEVPVNYSKKQLEKAPLEVKNDKMIAYLTDLLIDHMDVSAASLGNLGAALDLNEDGMIDMDDIQWLTDNRLTTALEEKYIAVKALDN